MGIPSSLCNSTQMASGRNRSNSINFSCTRGYNPSLDHLMMMTTTLILGDFNARMVSGFNFGILNWDSPTGIHQLGFTNWDSPTGIHQLGFTNWDSPTGIHQLGFTNWDSPTGIHQLGFTNWDSPTRLQGNANPSSPDVSLASASLITSTNWQTRTHLGSDHLPIIISLQTYVTINPIQHRSSINMKKENWDRYSRNIEDRLNKRRLPTNCQKGEKILRAIIFLKHHTTHPLSPTQHRAGSNKGP